MNTAINNKSKIILQLQKLRRLSQPFFLPIDQNNGIQFIWLLISLLFCVGGIVLVLLTGLINLLENFQPALLDNEFLLAFFLGLNIIDWASITIAILLSDKSNG